ncbi:2-C-methyl-D-erythritol 4-phosphate cytidylyltransferase [Methylomagnum ishizawai]|uniref:2-C-methyl-D-erythritol 4-phosphate cytidylyltransferase n=1 Tax=Methylomagnum ishizawai TaxID=1760988 RepID=UPI001C32A0B6|nr:2-C-methyl-D-erythritol 4-phosphate cytidylyltransferase [Methylomagnum ishizawai]BBL74251.1 2-C-methyl-D-erythritol 4-phosphate cytidylyltransferase [Methylomagnum ishizawai]
MISNNAPRFWAVVPAAGVGKRMGADVPKQYLEVLGKPVLQHTLERLLSVEAFSGIAVALGHDDGYWPDLPCATHPKIRRAPGGKERADSVLSGLRSLENEADPDDWVLVHDAARPCLARTDVEKLMATLKDDPVGGILGLPVSDTLKSVEAGHITGTVDRGRVWRALTPQMFRYGLLRGALEAAAQNGWVVTDEASAIELKGLRPKLVEGRPDNLKITRPEDLPLAVFYMVSILSQEPGDAQLINPSENRE